VPSAQIRRIAAALRSQNAVAQSNTVEHLSISRLWLGD
jgi:hypothetical protein